MRIARLRLSLFLCFVALLMLPVMGCADQSIYAEADRARLEAVREPIDFYVDAHPDQRQTWSDFLDAWNASIEARRVND